MTVPGRPLAIFAPQIGAVSETFVRRHAGDLLPGGTVVVTGNVDRPFAGNWRVDGPMLVLNQVRSAGQDGRSRGIVGRALRRLGVRSENEGQDPVRQFLEHHRVEVVMSEYLDISLAWLPLARDLGLRFFAHAHGYDVSASLRDPEWREEYLKYREADGIITVSRASRKRLLELGLPGDRIHVVPCGVDVPPEPLRRPPRDEIRCLAVGRMVPKKAPVLLLDAFRRAAEACPGLRLDCIGDGPLLPAARQFVHAFGLAGKVTLHGAQPGAVVQEAMRKADIFLQHSMTDPDTGDEEGLPVAVLEAMACALPVVSTRHAGIPEAVLDGETGALVEEGDSRGMAREILSLARESARRTAMGMASWQRARDAFSWTRERKELLDILGVPS